MRYEELDDYVLRFNDDGSISSIPKDPANSDYQRYLNPETDNPIGGVN